MKKQLASIFFLFLFISGFSLNNNVVANNLIGKSVITESGVKQNTQRYTDTIFSQVDVTRNIVFGEAINSKGVSEKLLLDVYSPSGDKLKNRPVIMWIHGGGFRLGNDKSQSYIVRMASEFAKRGYVCLSINYRLRNNPKDNPHGTMTDALADAMAALNWLRNNDEKLGIDKNKIIIGGGSAGGKLATNLCYKDNSPAEKWDKSGIVGLVNLWGSPDESWMMSKIDKNDPPTIIVHGTKDELVPYELTEHLVKELKTQNVKFELITIEGAEHTPSGHIDEFVPKIAAFLYGLIN